MANNLTGNLRVGSVVKDKVILNHEAKVVSIDGDSVTLESLNRREAFHHSEQRQLNELAKSLNYSPPYAYISDRPDFQFHRKSSELELVRF